MEEWVFEELLHNPPSKELESPHPCTDSERGQQSPLSDSRDVPEG